jgi:hypothetical protein
VADETNCLGVTFESSGWKLKTIAKGNQTSVAGHKCLVRTPHSRVKILENIYEMINKPRIIYGIDMWGLDRQWKGTDKTHSILACRPVAK